MQSQAPITNQLPRGDPPFTRQSAMSLSNIIEALPQALGASQVKDSTSFDLEPFSHRAVSVHTAICFEALAALAWQSADLLFTTFTGSEDARMRIDQLTIATGYLCFELERVTTECYLCQFSIEYGFWDEPTIKRILQDCAPELQRIVERLEKPLRVIRSSPPILVGPRLQLLLTDAAVEQIRGTLDGYSAQLR